MLDGFRAFLPEVRDARDETDARRDGDGDDAKTTMARDDEGAVTDGDARRAGRGAGILDGDGDGERDARARTTGDVERARKTEKGAERAGGGDEARMRGARATATRARRARGGENATPIDAGKSRLGSEGLFDESRPVDRLKPQPSDRPT